MEKRYYLNDTNVYALIDKFFPVKGALLKQTLDLESLNEENLNNFFNKLEDMLEDVRIEDSEEQKVQLGDLDFIKSPAKEKLKELFSNSNLTIFGHGGNVNDILGTGHFYCKYPKIDSHFVPLEWSESLDCINHWKHRNAKRILFLALNNHEINPIFQDIDSQNVYSDFRYEIPLEYFAGYYDSDTQEFVANPQFKEEHNYNEQLTLYVHSTPGVVLLGATDEINEFYKTLRELAFVFFNSNVGLSKKGYEGLCKQVVHYVEILRKQLLVFNDDYAKKLENKKIDDTLSFLDDLNEESIEEVVFNDDLDWEESNDSELPKPKAI